MTQYHQTILKLDANKNVIQNSYGDMAYRADFDGGSNAIYKGFARPGASEDGLVWQIQMMTYDTDDLVSITWPHASNGAASSEFNFSWTDRASYTYS